MKGSHNNYSNGNLSKYIYVYIEITRRKIELFSSLKNN